MSDPDLTAAPPTGDTAPKPKRRAKRGKKLGRPFGSGLKPEDEKKIKFMTNLDPDLAATLRARIPDRKRSAFIRDAIAEKLARDGLA